MDQKNKFIAALVTAIIGIGVISWFMFVEFHDDSYRILGGAVVMVVEILAFLLISAVLLFIPGLKSIASGILIGTGITALVGFGVCSMA